MSRRALRALPGIWFEITDGELAGYYVTEIPGRSYLPGKVAQVIHYDPPLAVWLSPGSHTGYRFADDGMVIATEQLLLGESRQALASERAVINGRTHRLLIDGPLAGYWIPVEDARARATLTGG